MPQTLAGLRAKLEKWLREPVDPDLANDAINDAVKSLWGSLVQANVGEYVSRQPADLLNDDDPIPFDEIECLEFLKYYALAPLALSIHETDQAIGWERKAEGESPRPSIPGGLRQAAILEVLAKSRRQERISQFNAVGDPYRGPGRV
jgi:hypothetical protein